MAVLVLAVLSCSIAPVYRNPRFSSAKAQAIAEASVAINVVCHAGAESEFPYTFSSGSGVLVGKDKVITARHVIDCTDEEDTSVSPMPVAIEVRNRYGKSVSAVISKHADNDADATLLSLMESIETNYTVTYSEGLPKIGEKLCISTGYSPVGPGVYKCGYAAFYYDEQIVMEIHIVPGNSGSAVYNEAGRYVGIAAAGIWHPSKENMVLIVPVKKFISLVK